MLIQFSLLQTAPIVKLMADALRRRGGSHHEARRGTIAESEKPKCYFVCVEVWLLLLDDVSDLAGWLVLLNKS